jgi:putative endopeptidase
MKHLIWLKKPAFLFFGHNFETQKTGGKIISNRHLSILCLLILCLACFFNQKIAAQQTVKPKAIDRSNMDFSVKPEEDFYLFVNGNWIKNNPIPGGYSAWGAFEEADARTAQILRGILEDAQQDKTAPKGSTVQLLRDFYAAAMDTATIERARAQQLEPYLAQIESLKNKDDLARLLGEFHASVAGQAVFLFYADADVENPGISIAAFKQGGIALPNRSYYMKEDAESEKIRVAYRRHIEKMFRLLGETEAVAKSSAESVMKLEFMLAINSITAEDERDPKLTFHKMNLAHLQKLSPHFNWSAYFNALGLPLNQYVNVVTPDFFVALSEMSRRISLKEWKAYLKWNVLMTNAKFLSSDFVDENFNFFEKTLRGVAEMKPRWQRVQEQTENYLGWALAREYVKKNFSPEAKVKMLVMIQNIKEAFGLRIKTLDWMSEETKQKALVKLDKITVNVGYPDKFPDLSKIEINPSGFVANVVNVNRFDVKKYIGKLGRTVDKTEFGMTPQTVNAYYSPPDNKIVFPAGILQPPTFHESYDDAVNYGGIGSVIAHEFTHAFDDQGSQYDAEGKLNNWWTQDDLKRFQEKQKLIIEQFNAYTVLDNVPLNGTLTVGENIADLGGVSIAFDAFQIQQKKNGRQPDIDGFTPEQRFFIAYAQMWRVNTTHEAIRLRIKTRTTSYQPFRVNAPLSNLEGFINAFQLKESNKMVRSANKRIKIW